ncbi:MAG: response regulator [Nitrospinae bacterium]|nr:response regulator [Nitrospinota bacterium]
MSIDETGNPLNILMVEDEPAIAILQKVAAEDAGHRVVVAENRATAMSVLDRGGIDLITLDHKLPDASGEDLLVEIIEKHPTTPVILVTGHGDEALAARVIKLGARDYLVKDAGLGYIKSLPDIINRAWRDAQREARSKKLQSQLLESEERFRTMADTAPVMIWIAGPDSRHIYFNKPWIDFTGKTLEQELGEGWAGNVHTDDQQRRLGTYLQAFNGRSAFTLEYRLLRHDGKYRWILDNGIPRFLPDGSFAGYIGSCVDITERKEAEDALRQAKEKAEEATRLKDRFVSMVTYDLKSPLTSITGLLKVLVGGWGQYKDDEKIKVIKNVAEIGDHMGLVIEELLNISRLKTGQIKPRPMFLDGRTIADLALERVSGLAREKGIELVNDTPAGLRLYADINLFSEVVYNLVSNAVKFSDRGGNVVVFAPDGRGSAIAVKDSGVGVPPEVLPKIFSHETRVSTEGTAGEKGTGFGLPYSHDIMEAHGGQITAESIMGQGSVFTARLPYVRPRILIVDDEKSIRFMLTTYLAAMEVDILEAANGEEAMRRIDEIPPHLIVSDIYMPDMDGFRLLERVRKDPAIGNLPFIVLTADSHQETRDKAFRLGASDFVTKPVQKEEFMPRVRRFVF